MDHPLRLCACASAPAQIPVSSTLRAALSAAFISRESARQVLLAHVNAGGLPLLYRILLDSAQPELTAALRVAARAVASGRWVGRHCTTLGSVQRGFGALCGACAGWFGALRACCCLWPVACDLWRACSPVLFYCKAGKDRTGLLAMLLLAAAGVPRDAILDDYHR